MLDRQKIEAILTRRFPGANIGEIAAAANGIMGLSDDEWEEIGTVGDWSRGPDSLPKRAGLSRLMSALQGNGELRVFRRTIG